MERDIIRKYLDIRETKSGILTEGGKCLYLYGNICCEARCRRFFLRSEQTEICSEYAEGFLVVRSSDRSSVYHNSKRMLRVKELIVLYEIDFEQSSMYGVFSGGKDLPLADSHFTDRRISELIDRLIVGGETSDTAAGKRLEALEQAVVTGEVNALNDLFLHGKPIE